MREETGLPAVLTGDFNVTPEHPVVRGLEASGYRNGYSALGGGNVLGIGESGANEQGAQAGKAIEIGRTFHDFAGGTEGEPIDYIFTSPDVRIERIEVDRDPYEGRYPSDHYPVCAVLER